MLLPRLRLQEPPSRPVVWVGGERIDHHDRTDDRRGFGKDVGDADADTSPTERTAMQNTTYHEQSQTCIILVVEGALTEHPRKLDIQDQALASLPSMVDDAKMLLARVPIGIA